MTTTYMVKNVYSEVIVSKHRKVEMALKKVNSMETLGWYVLDSEGNEWDIDFEGRPVIYRHADED
jgi:hypothetical protein